MLFLIMLSIKLFPIGWVRESNILMMIDRSNKNFKSIEVGIGLLVGYVIGGLMNMAISGKAWEEAFKDDKLIFGIAGIGLSVFLYFRQKRKSTQK